MIQASRSRPSAAMVVAVVALAAALAGTAVAGPSALTRPISKSKVKKIAKKQADKLLTQREGDLNVNSARTADSAAFANSAAAADSAETLGGVTVTRVFKRVPSGGAAQGVLTRGGVRVTFGCIGADPQTVAVSQVNNSAILSRNNAGTTGGGDFDAGAFLTLSVVPFGDLINFEFVTPSGAGATGSLRALPAPSLGSNNCTLTGSVIAR